MKILIADDHAMVRRGLCMLLDRLFDDLTVEGVSTIEELLRHADKSPPPDIILLDLFMPDTSGLNGLDMVRKAFPNVAVAIISASEDPDDVLASIRHGASGFILKSSDDKVLKLAVSLILSGETYVPSHVLGLSVNKLDPRPGKKPSLFPDGNPLGQLTQREYSVLNLLMKGQSNKEIARHLDLLESSVKKYIGLIFKKLNVTNRTHAVITAAQLGWPAKQASPGRRAASN